MAAQWPPRLSHDELVTAQAETLASPRRPYGVVCWLLYVLKPEASYRLNADFEDHAEHEYVEMVRDHPDCETTAYESALTDDYGRFQSLADVFRQIGHDERIHKLDSMKRLEDARYR